MERRTALRASGLPCSLMIMEPQEDLRLHAHDHVELVLITGGRGAHVIAGRRAWHVVAGDVFVIPAGLRHGYRACRDLHLTNILIDATWLAGNPVMTVPGFRAFANLEPLARSRHDFSSHLRLDPAQQRRIHGHLQEMVSAFAHEAGERRLTVRARLELILLDLARWYREAGGSDGEQLLRLDSVLRLIDEELDQPLSLESLADAAHVSVSTLNRLFHESFACSPVDYLIAHRIDCAKRLLREGREPIATIAARVGIPDPSYFARLFRQRCACSPRAWRLAGDTEPSQAPSPRTGGRM